jgi:mannonate dehydratase
MNKMIQTMRWYGPSDTVSLIDILQAGCSGVVSALHSYAPGEVWPYEAIVEYRDNIAKSGMKWEVVESLPVHDHIKVGYPDRDQLIDNYIESIRNLGKAGVNVVTYNFMPLLDWLRTDVRYKTPTGGEILYFNWIEYAVFDLFILKRATATADYPAEKIAELQKIFEAMPDEKREMIKSNFLLALPGSSVDFTLEYLDEKTKEYSAVTPQQMKENLAYFLGRICPVADEVGVKMAIHPDDPPYSIFGLPRIMSKHSDFAESIARVPNKSNGLCFCTGSFGARADNDLVDMVNKFGERINFLHLRNTKRLDNGDFYEADHLAGDADIYGIIKEIVLLMQKEGRSIPMRPDHGPSILDDLKKKSYPGYSAIGRLKGLAELRGVEYAITEAMSR